MWPDMVLNSSLVSLTCLEDLTAKKTERERRRREIRTDLKEWYSRILSLLGQKDKYLNTGFQLPIDPRILSPSLKTFIGLIGKKCFLGEFQNMLFTAK